MAGNSWEGLVLEHLIAAAPSGTQSWFYRTVAGAEIDLLLEIPGQGLWAYEVKRSSMPKVSPGFYRGCEDITAQRQQVIYNGSETYPLSPQVNAMSLATALQALRDLA